MHLIRFDSIDSTHAVARRMLDSGELADRTLIIAGEQTAGRGTKGRAWSSPRDAGVYLTYARVFENETWPITPAYTLAAGLACAEVLRRATGVDVRVKPVNDLIVAGRKLGGILTESIIEAGQLRALFTGVGVNVRRAPLDLPPDATPPTCVQDHLPPDRFAALSIDSLAPALAAAIDDWHASVAAGRFDRLTAAWRHLGVRGTPMPTFATNP
jgi:biotin-[acetyl-CoA-carboxylase] ligase BirA-like protein